jgi:GntR family phosphonate transport system transcriptional regulator
MTIQPSSGLTRELVDSVSSHADQLNLDTTVDSSPIYAQIAATLRRQIHDGEYAVGDRLPAETQLANQFKVNRHTLRQAIALLRTEGIVRVEQGRGTFIANRPIRYTIGQRVRYNEALRSQGLDASLKVVQVLTIPASEEVALGLGIELGQPVALVERLAFADQMPISLTSSHFPIWHFPNFLSEENLNLLKHLGSISRFLRQVYNCDHIRLQTAISTQLVTPRDARLLEFPVDQPILRAESINIDQHGTIIEYGVSRFRGDRMELAFENCAFPPAHKPI